MTNFDVHGFARQLAQVMNWTYDEAHDQSWTALIHEPGTKAELWIHDDRGRARISGGFDVLQKYVHYERRGQNEITVDPKRPLVRIKADIERRLLPDYRTDLLYVQKCDDEHHARMKQVANAALHFGAILQVARGLASRLQGGFWSSADDGLHRTRRRPGRHRPVRA